jgi:hypothetical protein
VREGRGSRGERGGRTLLRKMLEVSRRASSVRRVRKTCRGVTRGREEEQEEGGDLVDLGVVRGVEIDEAGDAALHDDRARIHEPDSEREESSEERGEGGGRAPRVCSLSGDHSARVGEALQQSVCEDLREGGGGEGERREGGRGRCLVVGGREQRAIRIRKCCLG